ncbi:MAG: PAS domain S-box protein [Pseudomonadota bacterium]
MAPKHPENGIDASNPNPAEKALAQYRRILSATPDSIALVGTDYIYRIINDGYLRRTGRRREDIVGRSVADVMGQEAFTTLAKDRLDRCFRGEEVSYQAWFAFDDEGRRCMDVTYSPYAEEAGDIVGAVIHSRDITEMKHAEEVLIQKETQFRQITNQIPGIVFQFVLHQDGGISVPYVSDFFEALSGIPSEELAVHPELFLGGVDQEDRGRMWKAIAVSAESLSEFRFVYRLVTHTESHRWFLARSAPREQENGDILWNGVSIDITERVEAQQALEDSRRKMAALINAANLSAALLDAEGTVLECNDLVAQRLGWDRSALIGANIFAILPPEVSASHRAQIDNVIRTGMPSRFTDTRQGIVFDNSITPVFDAGGTCTAVAVQAIDITESRRLSHEQAQQLELLRMINSGTSLKDLIGEVIRFLTGLTGVAAIGIRIRQGDDFPYYQTRGFSEAFVAAESRLCAVATDGSPLLDAAGNPALECMCGNVLQGRFDPKLPFFTDSGSFWTNSTSKLLASTSEADRQARTRNRCHGEGYESVALIPMRVGNVTVGLIQFNDRKEGVLDADFIRLAERFAGHLAVAISQRIAEAALKNKAEELKDVNTALEVLLKKREADILSQGNQVQANVRDLIAPYLAKLKATGLNVRQENLVSLIEKHVADISSPFGRKLNAFNGALTPVLMQVASLVKSGATSKEIAQTLGVSIKSVETYRKRLRERLDIKNKKTNLRSYLLSFE